MSTSTKGRLGRTAAASAVGTVIEFYDFTIFGTSAALVFDKIFFSTLGQAAATAVALATFGVAFVVRPFGAALFGHFGDRLGRKNTLVATLLLMGLATVAIGLLPTSAVLGPFAAVLLVLLRCVQGLAMGGEWAGACLLSTESAPVRSRGKYGMFPQLGPALGFILSSITFLLTSLTLSDKEFLSWGWRIPFLISGILVVVGLIVRFSLEETEVFKQKVGVKTGVVKLPILELVQLQGKELMLGTGCAVAVFGLFYLGVTYLATYSMQVLGLTKTVVLLVGMAGAVALGIATVLGGLLSDRFGRKPVMLVGNLACLVAATGLFPFVEGGSAITLLIAVVVLQFSVGLAYGPLGAYLPELFAPRYRYTGAGLSYNLATVLGAALTPIVASQLISRFGSVAVGLYMAVLCALSLGALVFSKETCFPNTEAGGRAPGSKADMSPFSSITTS